jgi:palmitoyltransferase
MGTILFLAERMQTALRDLPPSDKILLDKEKKEALAKLDRAFS